MSKYIDADLYVEMQIYDDEHEEWSLWNGTIEDLLNQWTEEGCPPTIEVSEDCISREDLRRSLTRPLENNNADEMYWKGWHDCTVAVETRITDSPRAVPSRAEGEWIDDPKNNAIKYCSNCELAYTKDFLLGMLPYDNPNPQMVEPPYCPNCGADMRGEAE